MYGGNKELKGSKKYKEEIDALWKPVGYYMEAKRK